MVYPIMVELNRCYAVYLLIAIHPVAKGSGVLAYGCDASPLPIARAFSQYFG
ncbi:hypothetical protein [Crocosphaera sp.]|uniref:hypothetical protein n=1 Tax=Crocosphaera sp. TaxID=2729996 RepID=UPI002627F3AF|nr:hypothetical protein [Crocosphaera sp.]MDJ0582058.1 hypothetical protein [Crocosphaera sp.]